MPRRANAELGEAKVAELCLPLRVEDYVLWLQVAIDDVARMQMLERKCDARGEKYDGLDVASKFVYLGDLYAESGQTLQGSFSAVSTPIFASKYALESARRDLHNALLCTVP